MTEKRNTCSINDENCNQTSDEICRGFCIVHYARFMRHGDPLGGRTFDGQPERFLRRAIETETDECIEWPFGLDPNGYGQIHWNGDERPAHRIALELKLGSPPTAEHQAAHAPVICHNRACINPRHLRWATRVENEADRLEDETDNRGERHGLSKLKEFEVQAIFADARKYADIANEYGISPTTVGDIKRGKRWGWLTGAKKKCA